MLSILALQAPAPTKPPIEWTPAVLPLGQGDQGVKVTTSTQCRGEDQWNLA
jgi:hypothetical protein